MKCEKCNKEHPGPWPFGYTHVYCECGHEWEVENLLPEAIKSQSYDIEQTIMADLQAATMPFELSKIHNVCILDNSVSFVTDFARYTINYKDERYANKYYKKLINIMKSDGRIIIETISQ